MGEPSCIQVPAAPKYTHSSLQITPSLFKTEALHASADCTASVVETYSAVFAELSQNSTSVIEGS